MEGEKSEKGEKISELLEFLKKEKKQRGRVNKKKLIKENIEKGEKEKINRVKSIKESIRHEDLIYFTFLISLALIIISSNISIDFTYSNQEEPVNLVEKLLELIEKLLNLTIYLVTPVILFFASIRFIGIIFESKLLRYFSLHGLFCSIVLIPLFFLSIAAIGIILEKFPLPQSYEYTLGSVIFLAYIFSFMMISYKIIILVKKILLETKKYVSLQEKYEKKINELLGSFYSLFIFPLFGILYFIDSYMSNKSIESISVIFLITCLIIGISGGYSLNKIRKENKYNN